MINKVQRLNHKNVYHLLKKGHKLQNQEFIFKFLFNKLPVNRYTVIISKKIVNKAVKRNRLRRQIYEILRLNDESLQKKIDIAVIVKREAKLDQLTYQDLEKKVTILYTSISQTNEK